MKTIKTESECSYFIHEPGNGSRYEIILSVARPPGLKPKTVLTLVNFRTAMEWPRHIGEYDAGYVASKLGVPTADATALIQFMDEHGPWNKGERQS